MWKCRLARLPHTREVDTNRCVPFIFGHLHRWRETADSSVGSDDVKPTESAHRDLDRRLQPGEVADVNGVKIIGHLNMAGRIAASASSLYAKNLYNFLETLIDKKEKTLAVKWDDEIVKATMLTREGAVVHPSFAPKNAA